jgi:TolA-binding protein
MDMKDLIKLILVMLVACRVMPLQAEQASGSSALVAIRAALEDGLYDLAGRQCGALLKEMKDGDKDRGEAVVLMAQSLHGQGRYGEMLKVLGPDSGQWRSMDAGAAVYWQAAAYYEMGNWQAALGTVSGFGGRFRGSAYQPRAMRLEAWSRLKSGEVTQALAMFEQIDREYGRTSDGRLNLLEWGQALVAKGDYDAARVVFEKLATGDANDGIVQEGKLWLAQAMFRGGQWESAWNLLNLVATDTAIRRDRRARASLALSEINGAQTNFEAAVQSARQGVKLAPTERLRNRGMALEGRWLMKAGNLEDGAAQMRAAIVAAPGDVVSAELQMELAGAFLDLDKYERAEEEYLYYLESYTNAAGRSTALKGRGAALWNLKRYAESAAMYEKAAGLAVDPQERGQCQMKAADALFANGQYKAANEAYGKALSLMPDSEWEAQALFQEGECLARLDLLDKAEETWRRLVGRFPNHPLAERALLRIAQAREERGPASMRDALVGYHEVMTVYPQGALYAEALYRHGLVAYQLLQFGDALADFTKVVNAYSNSAVAPQAYFMRGQSLYMMGREEDAAVVIRSYLERYPKTEWASRVMFWLGEYAFNRGEFVEAERYFMMLATAFPKDAAADRALLWAGRAAMKQKEYLRAADRFAGIAEDYPGSALMDEVRFQQGDSLTELGEFSRAIVVFDELITRYPKSKLIGAAWGRKGDCQFTLGVSDVKRYDEAMASYKAVLRSAGVAFDLELQAEYKMGRCLEKLGKKDQAFEQYYSRVVVPYLERQTRRGGDDAASSVWFTKAAFAAADLMEAERDWKRAVKLLERVVDAKVMAAPDAQGRIDRIRAEHWIW